MCVQRFLRHFSSELRMILDLPWRMTRLIAPVLTTKGINFCIPFNLSAESARCNLKYDRSK